MYRVKLIFLGKTPEIIAHIRRNPLLKNKKIIKIDCCYRAEIAPIFPKTLEKNCRDISKYI